MKITQNLLLGLSLKVIAVLAFVYQTNQGFTDRITYLTETQNYTTLIVFFVIWGLSLFILLSVSFQQSTLTRLFWGTIISITTAISYGFYAAGGSELELLDVFELWQAKHETGRAISHFLGPAIQAFIIAFIGFLIIVYPPPKFSNRTTRLLSLVAWLPLVPMFILSSLIFVKSDKAIAGLPQQFAPVSMAMAIIYKSALYDIPKRDIVQNAPKNKAKTKHLLYLIDESINPDYLYASNGKKLQGFKNNQDKIADFGIAVSGSNCSARSNAILRLGAIQDNLIQSVRNSPSIWQYAKKAGFRTVYIDSQDSSNVSTKPNDFQNYMNSTEAAFIDTFHKVKNVPSAELDYKLLELVKKELESDVPTFIYANKNGAHFPYRNNYPKNEAIYQPVVSETLAAGLGQLINVYQKGVGMEAVINTYKNSIRWTVDLFFQKFFKEINLSNTTVIYTADHGQYFEESSTTHCTSGEGAPAPEGLVPLMLMTDNEALKSSFSKAAETNFNKADHFSLFPTVLNLFGYSKEIQNSYGSNLFDAKTDDTAAFNTGDILGVITTDTIWRKVSLEERIVNSPNVTNVPSVSINESIK